MSKLLFDAEGNKYQVTHYELITNDDLDEKIRENQENIDDIKAIKEAADKLTSPSLPVAEAPAASPEITPPAPEPTPAPEVPETPVEQPIADVPTPESVAQAFAAIEQQPTEQAQAPAVEQPIAPEQVVAPAVVVLS